LSFYRSMIFIGNIDLITYFRDTALFKLIFDFWIKVEKKFFEDIFQMFYFHLVFYITFLVIFLYQIYFSVTYLDHFVFFYLYHVFQSSSICIMFCVFQSSSIWIMFCVLCCIRIFFRLMFTARLSTWLDINHSPPSSKKETKQ
jgi:hypothetical protein